MSVDDFAEVGGLISAYFDGLYHADSARLRDVFHPRLAYVCATEGDEIYLDLETYMARIDEREGPAARNEPRQEAILEMSFASPRLAHVTAAMSMMGRRYLDHLTLVRQGRDWRIISKVFAYVPERG
ncbi:nuclear transport factor 2 family protein [Jannaschia pohangensis]|uniref:Putative lumazine-binding n=1 Tax=Jannaschia pohangensis TaxID=390807 RepID=A0A1I3TVY4_9RHOB|nr:nuclear transport factor 2 family protein [Jannaschia pohangensis]SFJ75424.1 Putative lumazine-binding [Jannaschia pohangensis]